MPIAYHELKPQESQIQLNEVNFILRPFDLSAQVWAYNHFATPEKPNGVEILSERIQDINDFGAVLDTTWHLLKDKAHFHNNQDNFNRAVDTLKHKYSKAMEFRQAIVQCLGVSQPKLDEIQGDIELKKSLTADV